MDYQTLLIGSGVFVFFCVIVVAVWSIMRDIATHTLNAGRAIDHIWVEFLPIVGKSWDAIVKLENRKTGEFKYKGRTYFAGMERVQKDYPPGRSKLAQVTFDKCYVDPSSADMVTCLHGKPTVDAVLVEAMAEQKDTTEAMSRSREESGGGAMGAAQKWVLLGIAILGVLSITGIIFTIKGAGATDDILATLNQIAAGFGVK